MSIIIAKIEDDSCVFRSDTKVSIINGDDSVTGDNKLRLNPNEGVLKVHIIHPAICLAFAGTVKVCLNIIYDLCRKLPIRLNEILTFLQESLIEYDDDSEFILGSYYFEKLELYKIGNQGIEKGNSFWIGNQDAFSEFQSYYNSDKRKKTSNDRFGKSFDDLIRFSKIPTIGDFIISSYFRNSHKCFVYEETLISTGGYGIIKVKANVPTSLSEGTVFEGAFTVTNLVSDRILRPAVCLYFQKAEIAYLYFPISNLVKSAIPIVIKDITIENLKVKVQKQYRINLIGMSLNLGHIKVVK